MKASLSTVLNDRLTHLARLRTLQLGLAPYVQPARLPLA